MGLIVVEALKMGLVRSYLTLGVALDMPVKVSLNLLHAPNMYRAGVGSYPAPCEWVVIPVVIHIDIVLNYLSYISRIASSCNPEISTYALPFLDM